MTIVLCRAHTPEWHDERRKRVTGSDIASWIGIAPSYWDDKQAILERKLMGVDKEFDPKTVRRMAHGVEREALGLELTGKLFGYPTARYSYLITHERWPYLAATLDGLLFPWVGVGPDVRLTSQPERALQMLAEIDALLPKEPVLTEIKVSDSGHRYKEKSGDYAGSRPWVDFCPDYHLAQVQTGLWMTGLDTGLLSGFLGGDELLPWVVRRSESWMEILDAVNAEAEQELAPLWGDDE